MLSADDEVARRAEVGHDQGAHGVGPAVRLHPPGGGADAPLEAQADHAGAAAHGPLLEVLPGVGQSLTDMLRADVEAPDVVEPAVVALGDQAVHRAGGDPDVRVPLQHVPGERLTGGAHAQGVGEEDGGLDGAQLLHLDEAHALAEAVDDRHPGHHLVPEAVAPVGQHGGDAGVDVPFL